MQGCARRLGLLMAACVLAGSPAVAAPLNVVASFSILGDMVSRIGGDHISLTTIVGPDGDAHSFEPRPSDAKALAHAQLLVVNGLNFEVWLPRLVKASGFSGVKVVASEGIVPRLLTDEEMAEFTGRDHADEMGSGAAGRHDAIDPHAWQSLSNGMIYAKNIASALIKADPKNAKDYRSRAEIYISEMKKMDEEVRQVLATIPADSRNVVTSHDSFGYFGRDYGVHFIPALGISSDAEPSAQEMARLVKLVKQSHSKVVFLENVTSPKLVEQIARETGAKVGGTLYSDALAVPDRPAGTYLGMFSWNAGRLIYAINPGFEK
jgi:zinc/manganese transport system substrate-binding protein